MHEYTLNILLLTGTEVQPIQEQHSTHPMIILLGIIL